MPRSFGTSSASPGGSNTYVQFNNGGSFGGDADLTWNNSTKILSVLTINGIPEATLLLASPNATAPGGVRLNGGDATGGGVHAGGEIDMFGGTGSDSANGGGIGLNGGTGGPSDGPGGGISIRSGDGAGGGVSGDVFIFVGNAGTNAKGGQVNITSGIGNGVADGGDFNVTTGDAGTVGRGGGLGMGAGSGGSISGNGGLVLFASGNAIAGDSDGGDILFIRGSKSGAGRDGQYRFYNGNNNGTPAATLDPSLITADRTYQFPDASGIFMLSSSGTGQFADNETPSGTIDSSNTAFALANSPSPTGSLQLLYNGQFQLQGTDYTLSGNLITFATPPFTGTWLRAFYRY